MPARVILLAAALLSVTLAAPAQAVGTVADVTVILESGWTYRTVSATLLEDGRTLEITRPDGAILTLAAADVAVIRDAAGNDITGEVIPLLATEDDHWDGEVGGRAAPPPPAAAGTPPPRAFDVAIGAGAGYGFPFGDFNDGLDAGLLYGAEVRLATSGRNYVKLCYRSQSVYKQTITGQDVYSGDFIDADLSINVREYLFLFGVLSSPRERSRTRGYTEFGLGYGDYVLSASSGSWSDSDSEGRLMLALQAGALIPFGKDGRFGADIGGHVLAKFIGGNSGEDVGFIFGMQAGLVVMLGGE